MIDINEVQGAKETLANAFEEYKSINDMQSEEIEKKGSADVLLTEELGRINDTINNIQDDISSVKTAIRRPMSDMKEQVFDEKDCDYKNAFMDYVKKGVEQDLQMHQKGMNVISDQQGGYMVPTEMADRIVSRQYETTPMRQISTVMNITSEAVEMLRDTNDTQAKWVSELDAREDTDEGTLGRIRIPVHELFAQPKATQKLLDDAGLNVEDWLINKVANKFSCRENLSFVNGDGVGQPRGFLSYQTEAKDDANRDWGVLEHVATGADAGFSSSNGADVLIELMNKLKAGYLPKATWLMPRSVIDVVRKFKESGSGSYLWQPSLEAGTPATLLGYPVIVAEDMPAMSSGSLSVAFGNFEEGYTIVDRLGLQVLRDPYTAAPFVKFRIAKRVGGDVVNFEAIKVLKFATA